MKRSSVSIVCVRDNLVTRFCSVITDDADGAETRIFDGCFFKDGSLECARCHESVQGLLHRNPSLPEDDLAQAYNARQSR